LGGEKAFLEFQFIHTEVIHILVKKKHLAGIGRPGFHVDEFVSETIIAGVPGETVPRAGLHFPESVLFFISLILQEHEIADLQNNTVHCHEAACIHIHVSGGSRDRGVRDVIEFSQYLHRLHAGLFNPIQQRGFAFTRRLYLIGKVLEILCPRGKLFCLNIRRPVFAASPPGVQFHPPDFVYPLFYYR